MHATLCLLRAGQPNSPSVRAEPVQFIGQFSWITGDPIGRKGLSIISSEYGNLKHWNELGDVKKENETILGSKLRLFHIRIL